MVSIYVGVAFKFRVKSGQPPFVSAPKDGNLDKKKKEHANKQAMKFQEQMGFDCVDVVVDRAVGDGRADQPAAAVSKRVYWQAASVFPLGVVTLKLHTPCVICGEHFGKDGGFTCKSSRDHFVCWGCFDPYVQSASEPGNEPHLPP